MLVFLVIIQLLFVFSLASVMTNFKDWEHYKPVYDSLEEMTFLPAISHNYNHVCSSKGEGFIWFANDNDFKLFGNVYLHASSPMLFDPYYLYWFLKYRKWFEENCSHLTK